MKKSTVALQDKTSSLARQLTRDSFQSRGRVTIIPYLIETWPFTFLIHPTINTLIAWNVESFQREFWERNPREKQDWLIHNLHHLILQIPLLSASPLTYPWEVHFAKSLSHHIHINEEVFWCLGSSSKMTNLFG